MGVSGASLVKTVIAVEWEPPTGVVALKFAEIVRYGAKANSIIFFTELIPLFQNLDL